MEGVPWLKIRYEEDQVQLQDTTLLQVTSWRPFRSILQLPKCLFSMKYQSWNVSQASSSRKLLLCKEEKSLFIPRSGWFKISLFLLPVGTLQPTIVVAYHFWNKSGLPTLSRWSCWACFQRALAYKSSFHFQACWRVMTSNFKSISKALSSQALSFESRQATFNLMREILDEHKNLPLQAEMHKVKN